MIKGSPEYLEFRKKANLRNKKYYSKPEVKAKKKLYKQEYDKRNKDKINEQQRKHRIILKSKGLLWSQKHPDKIREYRQSKEARLRKRISDRKWRDKNKEKIKERSKTPEFRAWKKMLYEKNKEHLKEVRRNYYKTERGILSYKRANHINLLHNNLLL